ncbi:MAG: N-acetyltransferase protein [Anaerolineales bacterium]|jgi:GNAT superfamily N-acetyltransferase|nr:N-acetyltransferase protein [Anaerolineales bacterium]
MAQVQVRPAASADLPHLTALDHGYSTDYVWQMDAREENEQTSITFRTVRLPRSMRVAFPRASQQLLEAWNRRVCFLVAEEAGLLKGYLNLTLAAAPETGWIADFAVDRRFRRSGVGSVLLASAAHWARQNNLGRLIVETQSKNYPAICFAQKHGMAFCGYNDRYYPNQDVALFFGMVLK